MRHKTVFAIAALVLSALAGTGSKASSACSWPMYGHDLGRSMAQGADCSQISALNVATLHPKWVFNAGAPVTAQPAVVDGTVYVGAADGVFYALPADGVGTVVPKWTFSIADSNLDSYGKFTSSAAVADVDGTRVVVVGGGSTLYVLDATTGAEIASQCFDPNPGAPEGACKGFAPGFSLGDQCLHVRPTPSIDPCPPSQPIIEIESSPAVVSNGSSATIFVGMDYNEGHPGRAGIVRLTLSHSGSAWSLNPDWKFDPEALTTYTTDVFTAGGEGDGCGNTWSSPTVDTAANLVYFDTSNCETGRHTAGRYGGESVFAIDATTGALAWCYSPRPINNDDLDFGATPNLINGGVGVGGKDGAYYKFDRTASGAADTNPGTACRGSSGHNPQWATTVATGGSIDGIIGTPAVGEAGGAQAVFATNAIPMPDQDTFSNPQRLTTLHAIDTATGSVIWDAPNPFPAYAGPAYTNGVVFMPDTFSMNFVAYSADYGIPLWTFPMFAPSGPPAIVGDSIYIGSGVEQAPDTPGLSQNGAVYAFQAVAP